MKKYILSFMLYLAIFGYGCNNNSDPRSKHTDSLREGNTDSSGSQPMQTSPGAANAGNATDTVANHSDLKPRTDSVVKH
ncbi:MAG TPA: hypothetical protein VFI33_06750 [Puia sp.]|nr:hypothetical protein [Puia sp.]